MEQFEGREGKALILASLAMLAATLATGSASAQKTVPTFQESVIFDAGSFPYGLKAADLIGIDSWPGIVVADIDMMGGSDLIISSVGTSEPGIYVFYNDGRDHFGPSVYFPTPLPARGVVARDFDNDGWIDLAAGVDDGEARTDKVYFLFNDQTGFFNPARLLQVDLRAEQGRQARDSDVPGMPAPAQDDEPRFIILGRFPGGSSAAGARGISPEGSVLVGSAPHAGFDFEAFRWTEQTGLVGLGRLVAWGISKAWATSSQGEVVVGWSHSEQGPEAFRWTQKDAMVGLGDLPGGEFNSIAHGVSWDGRVIVGQSRSPEIEAFKWTDEEGMVGLGGLPDVEVWSQASGASVDGSVIVGHASTDPGRVAFRWTLEEGMVALGDLPGGGVDRATVRAVSGDGRVIVGQGVSDNGFEAFRWTRATGFIGLGDLPGGRFQSTARAANANGSIVVGESIIGATNRPFIWTKRHGMRNLQDLIVNDLGLDIGDMQLVGASAISADGRWITGGAWTDDGTEGWVVYLGPGCPADYDGDADADAEDFFLYLDLFAAGDLRADIDDDGDIDQDDFFAYLDLFTTGCS